MGGEGGGIGKGQIVGGRRYGDSRITGYGI